MCYCTILSCKEAQQLEAAGLAPERDGGIRQAFSSCVMLQPLPKIRKLTYFDDLVPNN